MKGEFTIAYPSSTFVVGFAKGPQSDPICTKCWVRITIVKTVVSRTCLRLENTLLITMAARIRLNDWEREQYFKLKTWAPEILTISKFIVTRKVTRFLSSSYYSLWSQTCFPSIYNDKPYYTRIPPPFQYSRKHHISRPLPTDFKFHHFATMARNELS